jgi:hypothetical protein
VRNRPTLVKDFPPIPVVPPMRIVIDYDPVKNMSSLHVDGPMTIPVVIDILLSQTRSLWNQFITSQMGVPIIDPGKSGTEPPEEQKDGG